MTLGALEGIQLQITVVQAPELEPGDLHASKLQETIDSLSSEASTTDIPWKRGIALEKLGTVYFFTGQFKQAITTLNLALEAHEESNSPMVTRVYITLGLAFRSIGQAGQAIATWEQGINLLIDRCIKMISNEGTLLIKQTNVDHSTLLADSRIFSRIRKLCQTDLNFAILRNNMGVVYNEQGDFGMARKMFEESIEFSPSTVHYDHPVSNLDLVI